MKEGNIKGSWGRKIIDLSLHHSKILGELHLDDYFVETFSTLAYFLMNYKSTDKKEIASVEAMVSELGNYAGHLRLTLFSQAQRFREYVPRSEEFTAKMEKVWTPKFEPLCQFLEQFINLRYGSVFNARLIDMKTPITEKTMGYTIKKMKLSA